MDYIQESLFGKTYQERLVQTKEKISEQFSKNLSTSANRQPLCLKFQRQDGHIMIVGMEIDGALHTELSMLNFGVSPKDVVESTLSQILEVNAPKKYYLSKTACEGILRRAERRGKNLPPMLKEALEQMIAEQKLP